MVAEKVWHEFDEQPPMVNEFPPPLVSYRALLPTGGSLIVIGEHPELAWKLWGVPSAGMVVGETPHPERDTVAAGAELATAIWIISFTLEVIEKFPELAMLFWSPEYLAVIVADVVGV